jgi:methylated-DNA-protein-cysteine methyltransferase-like protein
MLKLIFSLDSVAVKSRTGIDTSPKEICAVANARAISGPLFYPECTWICAVPIRTYERIYRTVRRIPRGRVSTYGDVAARAGLEGRARQVGYALHALPSGSGIPWHRVVNAKGEISVRSESDSHELQRMLLKEEGIEFDGRGRIDLGRFGLKSRIKNFEFRMKK